MSKQKSFPFRDRPKLKTDLLADPSDIRIFVRVCIENVRDAEARHLPPHEIKARKAVLTTMWRALNDSRVRVKK